MKNLSAVRKKPKITDPRFSLLAPHNAKSFYIHRDAVTEEDDESVAGPFSSIEELTQLKGVDVNKIQPALSQSPARIERINASEIVADWSIFLASTSFSNYEIRRVSEDSEIIEQRSLVDKSLQKAPLSNAPGELIGRAKSAFRSVIDSLFHNALCSMTRVVLSARWPDFKDWVVVTVRDKQKSANAEVDVALLRMVNGILCSYVDSEMEASSSAIVAWTYHQISEPCFLLHAHLLAPVIAGQITDKFAVISAKPRSASFGDALHQFFSQGHSWVLRQGEGIWCNGITAEAATHSALNCQNFSLDLLQQVYRFTDYANQE